MLFRSNSLWVLESRLYTILKRGIPQCYELPSITTFPMVLYPIFDCFVKCLDGQSSKPAKYCGVLRDGQRTAATAYMLRAAYT